MPTGLFDSPSLDSSQPAGRLAPQPLVQSQPRKAINTTLVIVLAQTGVPQSFAALHVPEGLAVTLRGSTPQAGANKNLVRVALQPDELRAGLGSPITPDTAINFPVDHTGQIWVIGTAADGVTATISGVPIG